MRIVGTAWYVFGLLAVAALLESAVTYAPAAQHMGSTLIRVTLALAGVSGLGAIGLTIKRARSPESPIFKSRAAAGVALCVAAAVTLAVLLGVAGKAETFCLFPGGVCVRITP